jgi:hypothetical protein
VAADSRNFHWMQGHLNLNMKKSWASSKLSSHWLSQGSHLLLSLTWFSLASVAQSGCSLLSIYLRSLWMYDGLLVTFRGTRQRSWLGRCATSWRVAGSNSGEVIEFFNLRNPASSTVVLGFTQLLTEMSPRYLPEGKERPERQAYNLAAIFEPVV